MPVSKSKCCGLNLREQRFNFKSDNWVLGSIFAYTLSGGKYPFRDNPIERADLIKKNQLVQEDLIEPRSVVLRLCCIRTDQIHLSD